MVQILLLGAFGQRNVGDEALCRAVSEALPDHDVTIASRDPQATRAAHGRRAVPAGPVSVARALRRADAVVVGGGTIFKPLHGASGRRPVALLANTALLLAAARLRKVPVALLGVGAGELHGGATRRLARRIASRADLLVLRDEESAAVLADSGAPPPFWVGADLAWLLFAGSPPPRPRPVADGTPPRRVTVAVSHLAGDGTLERALCDALSALAGAGWKVRLQPWQSGGDDAALASRMQQHIAGAELIAPPRDLAAAAHDFLDDDLVVAMRFHALVAGGAAGRRMVAIAHEPKLAGLARRLDQISVPPDATPAVVESTIEWALAHEPATPDAVARQIALAQDTVDLLRVLIDPDRLDHPEDVPALQLSNGEGRW
jgi:polysaccharide pyruvyl transferase WcaK-like protein